MTVLGMPGHWKDFDIVSMIPYFASKELFGGFPLRKVSMGLPPRGRDWVMLKSPFLYIQPVCPTGHRRWEIRIELALTPMLIYVSGPVTVPAAMWMMRPVPSGSSY